MLVVIFRAKINQFDQEYSRTAQQLRDLALADFGCLDFHSFTTEHDEVALSYWPDEASILRWRQYAEHQLAQQRGKDHWYKSYRVEVAEVQRGYGELEPDGR